MNLGAFIAPTIQSTVNFLGKRFRVDREASRVAPDGLMQ
jgi:hypothetical protein